MLKNGQAFEITNLMRNGNINDMESIAMTTKVHRLKPIQKRTARILGMVLFQGLSGIVINDVFCAELDKFHNIKLISKF